MFYVQEILLGSLGLAAATTPLLLPHVRSLYRFLAIAGALLVASSLCATLAVLFFHADFTMAFVRAFLMIGILQNVAVRMPAYPHIRRDDTIASNVK